MAPKRPRTTKNAPSSSKQPQPITIKFQNPAHQTRFATIKDRELTVTKFPHLETLEHFRWEQGVRMLLNKGGLEGMLTKGAETWKKPTLEFLASFETCDHEGEKAIRFQLQGKLHTMKYSQICSAFGWNLSAREWDPPTDTVVKEFWRDMTGFEYNGGGGNKINMVVHPCYRYVLRLLNMTIFLNGESGGVRNREIRYFWALSNEGVGTPNWVELFVMRCTEEQQKTKGKICFGGMVTLLALELKAKIPKTAIQVQPKTSIYYDSFTLNKISFATLKPPPVSEWRYLIHKADGPLLPPNPSTLFHIPPNASTYNLRMQFFNLPLEELEVEGAEESEDTTEDEGEDDIMLDSDDWRAAIKTNLERLHERMGTMEKDLQAIRCELQTWQASFNANQLALQQQLQSFFSSHERPKHDPGSSSGPSGH